MKQEYEDMLSAAYAARGYLVVAYRSLFGVLPQVGCVLDYIPLFEAGSMTPDDYIKQKFRIVAETTRQDYMEQEAFCGVARPEDSEYKRFYRVESD